MQETKLVRTCIDADSHTLVFERTSRDVSVLDFVFDSASPERPTDALAVTYRGTEGFFETWCSRPDRPRNVGVVSVGERMRSAAATSAPERNPIRGVAEPTDTENIRDAVTDYLDAWPADGRTVVLFDSVTDLLDQTDVETATEFVGELRRTLDVYDAAGTFCLTPAAHDPAVVREVASSFDTVAETVSRSAATVASRPSVSDCFDAMADARRRCVLAAVDDGESVSVGELADRVAEERSVDRTRAQTSLLHVHLPKLAEYGLVSYDRERGLVRPGDYFERVEPYLRKALGLTPHQQTG